MEGACDLVLGFEVVGHGELVEEVGEVGVGLAPETLTVAVYTLLQILNSLWRLLLIQTLPRYSQIHMTSLRKVLHHHLHL